MSVERFPTHRVRRVAVNLPFERVPQCPHDNGMGEAPTSCPKCETVNALVDEMAAIDIGHGVTVERDFLLTAVETITSLGYKICKNAEST